MRREEGVGASSFSKVGLTLDNAAIRCHSHCRGGGHGGRSAAQWHQL